MSARNKLLLYVGLFLIIILGFWFFLFRGTDNWKSKLPVIGYIQPFSVVNQLGDTVTKESLAGKIYVANYFFVTCRGICPNMNGNVKKLYTEYENDPGVMFLSHTCQPEYDSIADLKRYSDSIGSDGKQWQFVTGDKLKLYSLARESYHIDDPKNNVGDISDQFLHSQFLALVDAKGQLRGVYDGLKESEMKQLKTDIDQLEKEGPGATFVNGIFGNSPAP